MCLPGLSFGLDFRGDVKWRVWKVPLGQRAVWVIAREQTGILRPRFRPGNLAWCCETVTLHYLFTIDICLGKGNGIQCVIFISALSPSLCVFLSHFLPTLSNLPLSLCHSLRLSRSVSFHLILSCCICLSCLSLKCYDSLTVISVSCLLEVCVSPECNHRMVHHFYYM